MTTPLTYIDYKNGRTEIPITLEEIKEIIDKSKKLSIFNKDPFPRGKVTFVGVGNTDYECITLWDMKYTDHRSNTYGGYFNEDHSGYNAWWTMNYNYSEKYNKDIIYIVDNDDDGFKLAEFLNFTHGIQNINLTIADKQVEFDKLKNEIEFLEQANKMFVNND